MGLNVGWCLSILAFSMAWVCCACYLPYWQGRPKCFSFVLFSFWAFSASPHPASTYFIRCFDGVVLISSHLLCSLSRQQQQHQFDYRPLTSQPNSFLYRFSKPLFFVLFGSHRPSIPIYSNIRRLTLHQSIWLSEITEWRKNGRKQAQCWACHTAKG